MQLSEVDNENEDGNIIPGVWRDTVQLTIPILLGAAHYSRGKTASKYYFKYYYNSDLGRIPWQDNVV